MFQFNKIFPIMIKAAINRFFEYPAECNKKMHDLVVPIKKNSMLPETITVKLLNHFLYSFLKNTLSFVPDKKISCNSPRNTIQFVLSTIFNLYILIEELTYTLLSKLGLLLLCQTAWGQRTKENLTLNQNTCDF